MPVKPLPPHPNLDHLKYQAKDLLKGHAARDPQAGQRLREFHPRFAGAADADIFNSLLSLCDAQLTIARESGFASWARLKRRIERREASDKQSLPHHERIEDPLFRRAVDLLDAGDVTGLQEHLRQHPRLTHHRVELEGENYFRNPSLLEFVAENPIRHGTLPKNIVEIARLILDAGVEASALNETLGLAATGRVPRECGVQRALIELLCDRGAEPGTAMRGAALHGEFDAVRALIERGALIDLPVAAALGRIEDAHALLSAAGSEDRHLALALASQFGHVDIIQLLLDAGENPNRYNPVGGHSHSTPLHQAALAGHEAVVRLLLERGADPNVRDILWQGTPAEWAGHAGRAELAAYLRNRETDVRSQRAATPDDRTTTQKNFSSS